MATTTSRPETGARGGPGRKQKEKTMIFHINRATYKAGLSEEQRSNHAETGIKPWPANAAGS